MKKKLIITLLISLTLSACNHNQTTTHKEQTVRRTTPPIFNVNSKLEKVKSELVKAWFTWEKLQKILKEQEKNLNELAYLTGDKAKQYIIETEILPKIANKVQPKCKENSSLDSFVRCMYLTKTPLSKLLENLPKNLQDVAEKRYYYKEYVISPQNLLKPTNNPNAIEAKKQAILSMFLNQTLSNPDQCNNLPDKQVKEYCKNLFK